MKKQMNNNENSTGIDSKIDTEVDIEMVDINKVDIKDRKRDKRAKGKNPLLPVVILLGITTLVSIGLCLYIVSKITPGKERHIFSEDPNTKEYTYTETEINNMLAKAKDEGSVEKEQALKAYIKNYAMTQGANLADLLRHTYPEYVICLSSEGYKFNAINSNYELHGIPSDTLILDDTGIITQIEGEKIKSKKGIDVSEYQGRIDWEKVKAAGVDFTIIRAGYRGYVTGKLVEDSEYIRNVKGALDNDIEVGLYYFTQAVTKEEIEEEVDTMLEPIEEEEIKITGPIVIDIEKVDSSKSRGNALAQEERTELVMHFCEYVRSKGYEPMIYGNTYSLFEMLDIDTIHDEKIWFAFYDTYLYYPYRLEIWQYSAKQKIDGIDGEVDIDIMFNCY